MQKEYDAGRADAFNYQAGVTDAHRALRIAAGRTTSPAANFPMHRSSCGQRHFDDASTRPANIDRTESEAKIRAQMEEAAANVHAQAHNSAAVAVATQGGATCRGRPGLQGITHSGGGVILKRPPTVVPGMGYVLRGSRSPPPRLEGVKRRMSPMGQAGRQQIRGGVTPKRAAPAVTSVPRTVSRSPPPGLEGVKRRPVGAVDMAERTSTNRHAKTPIKSRVSRQAAGNSPRALSIIKTPRP